MPADIIIYALVAAGLVFWLRNILGTRHGDERERPNPYNGNPETLTEGGASSDIPLNDLEKPLSAADRIADLAQNPVGAFAVDNKTAENGLLDIARQEKTFDVTDFLSKVQDAFVFIVEAYARGERDTLKDLLQPEIYDAFEAAIKEREERGETIDTEIHSIRKAEVIDAKVLSKTGFITIRFIADETSVTRDAEGKILSGHPDRISEMRDIWTFGRNLRSRDPVWYLYETRSESDDDGDLVPDTH